ncbi:acyl carrier protein [Yoonia sp.]|uniref:acyl carrier protein n=1 Tax=Yoonia sp. TaxID=2212373 RepID=UPI002FD9D838
MTDNATRLLAEALGLDPAAVDENVSIDQTPTWDSLAHFRLMLALEEHLGRKLTPVEVVSVRDFQTVSRLLRSTA